MNTINITNYKLKDFAELWGVSVITLQWWDRDGILKANRTSTDKDIILNQYLRFKGMQTENDIRDVVIYAKNRFVRFGLDWFEKLNTEIIIVNNETLSPNEELVQDIISVLHVLSCRLYGLRKYKKQIKEDEEIAEEL